MTLKNTEVNNGLEAWRGLNATYHSNKRGRQRVRKQILLQPKRAESILQTTETVERWRCGVRENEQRFGKTFEEDVKMGVILALTPSQVQNHCHLNSHILKSYAQVRTMLFDCCRAQADTALVMLYPWISRCWARAKARMAKATRRAKAKARKRKQQRREGQRRRQERQSKREDQCQKRPSTVLDTALSARPGSTR